MPTGGESFFARIATRALAAFVHEARISCSPYVLPEGLICSINELPEEMSGLAVHKVVGVANSIFGQIHSN